MDQSSATKPAAKEQAASQDLQRQGQGDVATHTATDETSIVKKPQPPSPLLELDFLNALQPIIIHAHAALLQ
jgi:hypothetical protein